MLTIGGGGWQALRDGGGRRCGGESGKSYKRGEQAEDGDGGEEE